MDWDPEKYKHQELTEVIIGAFYEVYNELGYGFLESVYQEAMLIVLREKGATVEAQRPLPVWFRGGKIGGGLRIESARPIISQTTGR